MLSIGEHRPDTSRRDAMGKHRPPQATIAMEVWIQPKRMHPRKQDARIDAMRCRRLDIIRFIISFLIS